MRVAALYDVHGMPWAVEAVLDEVEADAIVFGGDLVWGPYPPETLALIRSLDAIVIRGNADRDLDEWVADQLSDDERNWLLQLPQTHVLDDVFYCHATPRSDEEIITPETPDEKVEEMLAGVDQRLVVGGHTHMQQRRGRYVNAGSVGMPYEDDVAAFWAVISDDVEFQRTRFDVEHAIAETLRSGWPLAQSFVDENLAQAPSRSEAIAQFRPADT
ncbi:MAG: metallophosphoesterase family protein [Actinobacteria bacterium]|nr:MAG: metallophosphoesterase family protein [Actinomycetota bacterium]